MADSETFENDKTSLALISQKVSFISENVKDINRKLDSNYVTNDRFEPIQRLVYGLVALILVGVVGAIMAVIFKK